LISQIMIQNDRKSRKIRQLNWIKELAHVLDTMTSSLITYGIEMIEDPCNTCLVTACCTELCDKIADFWTHIYTEYKKSPNETVMKYGLNDMRAKTLKDLHEAAGHRPVTFTVFRRKINATIDFSIYDPPRKPTIHVENTLHDHKKSLSKMHSES